MASGLIARKSCARRMTMYSWRSRISLLDRPASTGRMWRITSASPWPHAPGTSRARVYGLAPVCSSSRFSGATRSSTSVIRRSAALRRFGSFCVRAFSKRCNESSPCCGEIGCMMPGAVSGGSPPAGGCAAGGCAAGGCAAGGCAAGGSPFLARVSSGGVVGATGGASGTTPVSTACSTTLSSCSATCSAD